MLVDFTPGWFPFSESEKTPPKAVTTIWAGCKCQRKSGHVLTGAMFV
jgi:hypothetical protein